MECDPTLSEDVAQRAWPVLRERLLQLVMAVPPSMKVTLPAGVPAPGLLAVTVAVKVTDCLNTDGLAEELTDVVVPYFTVCVSLGDVLALKFARPPHDALLGCAPSASVLVRNGAWPEAFRLPVPRVLGPSLKVTVPVGVPAPLVLAFTVAVKVTGCPDTDGLIEETTPVVVPGSVVVVVGAAVVVVVVVVVLVVVGITHGPLESQVPPPPHGAPVLGVTVQLDVPLQLRALQVSEVHVIAVPTHCPLPLQVSS